MPLSRRSYDQARKEAPRRLQTSPRRAHDLLRSSIRAGMIRGDSLLIEDSLVRSLSTSRNAIRQALQMLAQEGLVERRPHHGTSVVGEILEVPFDQLVPPVAFDRSRVAVRILESRQIPSTPYIKARLEIDDEALDVLEILITFDDEPLSLRVSYVPVSTEPVRRTTEVIPVPVAFEQVFGVPMGRAESSVEAIAAGASASRLLDVPEGAPVLVQEQLLRDINGVPRELSYTHYRSGRVSLAIQGEPTVYQSTRVQLDGALSD
jgi:DNA-binding GntR family transcriptional regulator